MFNAPHPEDEKSSGCLCPKHPAVLAFNNTIQKKMLGCGCGWGGERKETGLKAPEDMGKSKILLSQRG